MSLLPVKKRYVLVGTVFLALILFGTAIASRNTLSSVIPESVAEFLPFIETPLETKKEEQPTLNPTSNEWTTPVASSIRLPDTSCRNGKVIEGTAAEKYAEGGDVENSIETSTEGGFSLPATNLEVQMITLIDGNNQTCLLGYSFPKSSEGLQLTTRTTAQVAAFPALFGKSLSETQTILENLSTLPSFTKFLVHLETELPKRTLTELVSEPEYPGFVIPIIQEYEERYGEVNF